jgi:phage gpG-like protein
LLSAFMPVFGFTGCSMTEVKVDLQGMNDLLSKLQALGAVSKQVIEETIFDLATETQALAIQGINRGGSGQTYEKYNPRRTHTASAPGQYPATDTGRLASSVRVDVQGPTAYVVGTNVAYGPMLEFGTVKMAARPWLFPSFERAKVGIERELRAKLEAKT